MRIYIAHSKQMNYQEELYKPLRQDSFFKEYDLILPHEKSFFSSNTRDFYKTIDILIADCSEAATGLGIELGWVYDDHKPIYCIYQSGKQISHSLNSVTDLFYEYKDIEEMIRIIKKIIKENDNKS